MKTFILTVCQACGQGAKKALLDAGFDVDCCTYTATEFHCFVQAPRVECVRDAVWHALPGIWARVQ